MNNKARQYTLVELLVAMAILVIMMGFLFQFVIGAQRIWHASEKTNYQFDYSQVVFDVMEQDLKAMQFSTYPGETMPFYMKRDPNTEGGGSYKDYLTCAMFSNFTSSKYSPSNEASKVGTYPVIFYFDSTHNKFYRCAIDDTSYKRNDGSAFIISNLCYLFGAEYKKNTDFFGYFKNNILNSSLDQFDILAEGVENVEIGVFFGDENEPSPPTHINPTSLNNSDHYANAKPKAFKITLTMYDKEADSLEGQARQKRRDETRRVFTKIIFL